jgi:integrase
MVKLTEKELTALAKPRAKPFEIPVGVVPGLRLVIQPSGAQSWAMRYRHKGRSKKFCFGRAPGLDLNTARKVGRELYGTICAGHDPAGIRKAARQQERVETAPVRDRVEKIARDYLKHAKARTRASTAAETSRILRVYVLPAWKGKRLSEIGKADVRSLVADIASRAPIQANRVLTNIKTLCNWAVEQDLLVVSPCAGLKAPAAEVSRDRVLSDSELAGVWRACDGLGAYVDWQGETAQPAYGGVIKMLALTGQRLREVSEMRWSEIDLDAKVWNLPRERCKNGHAHQVPLSGQALAIITALPRERELVFVGCSSISRAKTALDAATGIKTPWVLHDLRRTAASGMARLGVSPWHIEAVLNHRSGQIKGVAATYNRYNFAAEKAAALALWGEHVSQITGGNIIRLAS